MLLAGSTRLLSFLILYSNLESKLVTISLRVRVKE